MKLAFCLFNYFPYGGLQRDFLRIARECKQRGHEIHVYTMRWEGDPEPDFHLHLLKATGMTNHVRCHAFAKKLKLELDKNAYDLVIGFNKMPYLDLYYAADVCYQARVHQQRGLMYRMLPRYHQMVELEKSVFAAGNKTKIMLISPIQQKAYVTCYATEAERFYLLPPGIAEDRKAPSNANEIRAKVRKQLGLNEQDQMLLMVGSGFKTKGVDRSLKALAALPAEYKERCHLFVIGKDDAEPYVKLAKHLNLNHVQFLGGRADIPNYLLAADLLLHPSYHENTGTAILEAIVAGLPVLTVEACGYAHYVTDANAGIVIATPFTQSAFNKALETMLRSDMHESWKENALAFSEHADIYSLPTKAADFIEQTGKK